MSEVPDNCNTDEYQCPSCDRITKVFRHKDTPKIAKVKNGTFKGNLVCKCGYHLNFRVKLNDGTFA
jgi:C4-type Zn-finger protein